MCNPMAIGMAIAAVGSTVAAVENRQAIKSSNRANAAQAKNSAEIHRELAKQEVEKGAQDNDKHIKNALQGIANKQSLLIAGGGDINSGTNLEVLLQDYASAQQDSTTLLSNSKREAWQHEASATKALNAGIGQRVPSVLPIVLGVAGSTAQAGGMMQSGNDNAVGGSYGSGSKVYGKRKT